MRDDELREGTIVYIKPKTPFNSAKISCGNAGESMRDISQMYAIKLSSLYKKIRLNPELLFSREPN
ncbi:MAG: hypothetical protein R2847_01070 [Bacteroidia bacterium]